VLTKLKVRLRRNAEKENNIMSLLYIVLVLIAVGVGLWAINRFIPMAGSIKSILNVVVIIVVVLWLLAAFGIIPDVLHMKLK
jgi:hypothetical protein